MKYVLEWLPLVLVIAAGVFVFLAVRRWRQRWQSAVGLRARLQADSDAYAQLKAQVSAAATASGNTVVINAGRIDEYYGDQSVGVGVSCSVCAGLLDGELEPGVYDGLVVDVEPVQLRVLEGGRDA